MNEALFKLVIALIITITYSIAYAKDFYYTTEDALAFKRSFLPLVRPNLLIDQTLSLDYFSQVFPI
jgi:hypothetical protein